MPDYPDRPNVITRTIIVFIRGRQEVREEEDAVLLTYKMEEGAASHRMQVASRR